MRKWDRGALRQRYEYDSDRARCYIEFRRIKLATKAVISRKRKGLSVRDRVDSNPPNATKPARRAGENAISAARRRALEVLNYTIDSGRGDFAENHDKYLTHQ